MIDTDLTTDEVAAALRLHRVTVQRWLKSGRLRGYQIGRSWRVPRAALEELRESGSRAPGRRRLSSAAPEPPGGPQTDEQWETALLAEDDLAAVPPIPAEAMRRVNLYEERR